ncbi:MAG: hypothetical protein IJS13_03305 [Paludibacteraceae bacterium]|nr:hypothetical protein [Paludibacteraceae bacterium]
MKHSKLFITALLSIVTLTAYADASALCAARLGTKAGNNEAFLRWETNDAGDVVITVYGDAGTAFRDATGMDKATLLSFTIGDGTLSTTDYFERQYTNNSTVWTLKFIGTTPLPAGTVIHFDAKQNVTWKTSEDGNCYAKYKFDYIYGSTCGSNPLPAPQNVAVAADGTVTFDAVEDAEDYMYLITLNGITLGEGYIESGNKIARPLISGGNYNIQLKARDTERGFSDYTAPVVWALEDESVTLENSEYCGYEIKRNKAGSEAYMTWQTDNDGNINIDLSGDGAHWRTADAFKGIGNFKVGSAPASVWFEINYQQNSTRYQLRLKDGMSVAQGEQIKYSGTTQWVTSQDGDAYNTYNFTYTYGTVCGGLETPSITSISADSTITITGNGADHFKITIYYNGLPFYFQENVHSGDKINFPAIAASTYVVTAIAQAPGAIDSDESEGYNWTLAGREVEIGTSEYCSEEFIGDWYVAGVDPTPWHMFLTFQTVDDDVVITITGEEGTNFRGADALGINNFSLNGVPASNFFNLQTSDGATEYRMSPKQGMTIPLGQIIEYNGTLCWRTVIEGNGYKENTHLEYTYGTVCNSLSKPVITAISDEQVITIDNADNAESFTVQVKIGDIVVYATTIQPGQPIGFVPRVSTTYQVIVTSRAAGMSDSEPSDAFNWVLEAVPFAPAPSTLCQTQIGEDPGDIAYLSWNTSTNGDVYIEISGGDGTEFRTNTPLTPSNFMVGLAPASNYFDFIGADHTMLFRLQKKEGALIGAGMEIKYQGNVQWYTATNNNAYILGAVYNYVYGTMCDDWPDPALSVGFENIENKHQVQKLLINGHLYISVDGHLYDATGRIAR